MDIEAQVNVGRDNCYGWIQNYRDTDKTIQQIVFYSKKETYETHRNKVTLAFGTENEWLEAIKFFKVEDIKDYRNKNVNLSK